MTKSSHNGISLPGALWMDGILRNVLSQANAASPYYMSAVYLIRATDYTHHDCMVVLVYFFNLDDAMTESTNTV